MGVGVGETDGDGDTDGDGEGDALGMLTVIGALQLADKSPEVMFAVLVITSAVVTVNLTRARKPQMIWSPPATGLVVAVMVRVLAS